MAKTKAKKNTQKELPKEYQELRDICERSLFAFAKTMFPDRYYGDVHQELFNWWQDGKSDCQLALIPRDHQKALTLDTKIPTPAGFKELREIKVGDLIFGANGLPQYVINLNPIVEQDIYRVTLDDGRVIECNEEHLWTVQCPSNTGQKLVTKPLKDIRKNYISNRFDKRNSKTYKEYRYFLIPPRPVQYCYDDNLPIDPYTLGAWLGDGDSSGCGITTADEEILNHIPYKVKKWSGKYRYGIQGITPKLRELGLLNNKHIPRRYLEAGVAQRQSLLQGLMDTDGFAHKSNKHLSFSTTSKQLCDDVVELVRSLGGKAKVHNANTSYEKDGKKFHSYCINIWTPEDIIPFRLLRKMSRVKKMRTKSAIVSIDYVGQKPARCITVENPDGLFLCNDFVVTHNSHCLMVYAAWKLTIDPSYTFVYVSANPRLAKKQLASIVAIFRSEIHRILWPGFLNYEKGRTGRLEHKPLGVWTQEEIEVDHPLRREKAIRDPSVYATSVKSTNTGFHFHEVLFDDLVTDENYKSEAEKQEVIDCYKNFAKIATTDSKMKAVGTRYGLDDLYSLLKEMRYDDFDDKGNHLGSKPMWDVFERVVEDSPRRTGW